MMRSVANKAVNTSVCRIFRSSLKKRKREKVEQCGFYSRPDGLRPTLAAAGTVGKYKYTPRAGADQAEEIGRESQ